MKTRRALPLMALAMALGATALASSQERVLVGKQLENAAKDIPS